MIPLRRQSRFFDDRSSPSATLAVLLALLATLLAPNGVAQAVDCTVADPPQFVWEAVGGDDPHYVGVLEYGEFTTTIGGETFTTRAYRQEGGSFSIPGPTLNMKPGNKYVLRFHNLLPYEPATHEHNTLTDPNVSNIHTHGLHISGESPGDDVTRMFEGGRGGDYVYDIPADHMGGTYWYHAHHHGSTFLQVSTGAFGMIVVDDSNDGIPAPVAQMGERQVVIGYLDTAAAGTGGDTIVGGTLSAGWTVNGQRDGTLCLPADTWQHWRVLLADREAGPKDVVIGDGCEVKLLARDGVWRTVAPKELPTRSITLTGASRADLAVRCSSASTIRVGNTQVATIGLSGTPASGPHPYDDDGVSTWQAQRPTYLQDLRTVPAGDLNRERINMGARAINGSKFDVGTPNLTASADAVQEWQLKGAGQHPFHLHIYHVQAMAGCGDAFEEGEFYDVVAASCSVRFDLRNNVSSVYDGRTIFHCHILEHEDQGAMGWLRVTGGEYGAPGFPSGPGYAETYALSGEPPPGGDPPPGGEPTALVIDTVVTSTYSAGRGQRGGEATVVVVDDLGQPVEGAEVTGNFSGAVTEQVSGITDAVGAVVLRTTSTAPNRGFQVTFCTTGATHGTLADTNEVVCDSS